MLSKVQALILRAEYVGAQYRIQIIWNDNWNGRLNSNSFVSIKSHVENKLLGGDWYCVFLEGDFVLTSVRQGNLEEGERLFLTFWGAFCWY